MKAVLGAALVLAAMLGAAPAHAQQLVDVGGWRLNINCAGEKRPGQATVVLEAGGGDFSASWRLVQPHVAAFARVCSYDRAGSGASDRGPGSRTMRQTADDLHTLLDRAGERPPFVLVGHSIGGFVARFYTSAYPSDVGAVVFVDSSQEEDLVGINGTMKRFWEGDADAAALRDERQRNPQPLGATPLVVITRGIAGYKGEPLEEQRTAERGVHQASLVTLSSRGRQVIAQNSSHNVPIDAPEVVIQAIREVLDPR